MVRLLPIKVGFEREAYVKIPVGVAELVVIPGDQLHKSWRQLNSSLGVHNGRPCVAEEVSGDDHVSGVAQDALEGPSLAGSLQHLENMSLRETLLKDISSTAQISS